MRENADTKARRLLVEARVRVLTANEDNGYLSAEVRGDSGRVYITSYDDGAWTCTCAARSRCSHARALMLVSVMEPRT